jgi:hypothetical protein
MTPERAHDRPVMLRVRRQQLSRLKHAVAAEQASTLLVTFRLAQS